MQDELRGTKRPPAGSGRSGTSRGATGKTPQGVPGAESIQKTGREIQCCVDRGRNLSSQVLGTRSSTTRGRRGRDTARAYTPYIANGARKVTTGFLFCGIDWADWGFSRENAVLTLAVRRVHAHRTGSPVTSGGGPGERGALAPWWTRDHRTPRGRSHGAIAQVGETGRTAGPGPVQVGAYCAGHAFTGQLTLAVRRPNLEYGASAVFPCGVIPATDPQGRAPALGRITNYGSRVI